MTITPRGPVILATNITPSPDKTDSGLYVADLGYARPYVARIFAVGPKVTRVGRGDTVILQKHAPNVLDDGTLMFMEPQISAIIERVE